MNLGDFMGRLNGHTGKICYVPLNEDGGGAAAAAAAVCKDDDDDYDGIDEGWKPSQII